MDPFKDVILAALKTQRTEQKTELRMWGTSIVGFGSYHYKYDSGRSSPGVSLALAFRP